MQNSFLFNQHGAFTEAGNDIARQVDKLFDDLIAKHPEINPRELSHLFTMSVTCAEGGHMLHRAFEARQKEKAAKVAGALKRLDQWESGYLTPLSVEDRNRLRILGFFDAFDNLTEDGAIALIQYRAAIKE